MRKEFRIRKNQVPRVDYHKAERVSLILKELEQQRRREGSKPQPPPPARNLFEGVHGLRLGCLSAFLYERRFEKRFPVDAAVLRSIGACFFLVLSYKNRERHPNC